MQSGELHSSYMSDQISSTALIPLGNNRFKSEERYEYSVVYEFLFDNTSEKVVLNLGQLMWVRQ